jgi:hypothetical protein
MSNEHKPSSPIAQKLRGMGLIPLPRWWVTPTEADIISRIAKHHLPTVMSVKEKIRMEQELEQYEDSNHGWSKYRPE